LIVNLCSKIKAITLIIELIGHFSTGKKYLMRIAIIGSGISGLGAAHALTRLDHDVVVYEKEYRIGGHSHTVDLSLDGQTFGVDTGFLVFNDRTYPRLIALFDELGVESAASDMSFAVRNDKSGLEWSGTNLSTLFADPLNVVRPRFLKMVADIVRFNRHATLLATEANQDFKHETLFQYLQRNHYGAGFIDDYLLPMAACIWSAPKVQILAFPLTTFVHFFHNHGLLSIRNRPQWRTVRGGSKNYVQKIVAGLKDVRIRAGVTSVVRDARGVFLTSSAHAERFDRVVFACHSDEALALLAHPTATETQALGDVKYQPNTAVLHTDESLMPKRRKAWSAWNYLVMGAEDGQADSKVSLTYWINTLQPLPCKTNVFVTLNPAREPDPKKTHRRIEYAHPLLNAQAITAQSAIDLIQGQNHTFYAGAWLGYGFHEDGLRSGQRVAEQIGAA
jgi:uncharacterized protein